MPSLVGLGFQPPPGWQKRWVLLHSTLVVGASQTAAFNRGRHLYSAGRPSRWTLAHILVHGIFKFLFRIYFKLQYDVIKPRLLAAIQRYAACREVVSYRHRRRVFWGAKLLSMCVGSGESLWVHSNGVDGKSTFHRQSNLSWLSKICNDFGMNQSRKLLNHVKSRKLKYFGHVVRHPSMEKDIMLGPMPGTRRQGGQRR